MRNVLNYAGRVAIRAAGCAAIVLFPMGVSAGEVMLKSADGTVNLVGEFVEFKDDNYVIRTALGDLRIAASRVRCEGADCPTFDTATAGLQIAGSDTIGLGLMPLLMSGYGGFLNAEATITNTQVENQILAAFIGDGGFGDDLGSVLVTSTKTSDGFKGLLDGSASIGMASRRITPEEARALRDAQKGNMVSVEQEHIIAVDSLVLIVNPENPITSVSIQDLQRIFSGEVTNWSQLGGEDIPITVVTRDPGTGTYAVFTDRVFGENEPPENPNFTLASDANVAAQMVNDTLGAIAYVGAAFQRGTKSLTLVNECGLASEPDAFSAKTEEYALQRRLYLYSTNDADEATKKFLEFTDNEASDAVIAKAGFIDLGIKKREQSLESPRAKMLLTADVDAFEGNVIREMLSAMTESDRLSTTFRFRLGSASLDERGVKDMGRLAGYLKDMPEGTKVTMVGFTDDIGAFESNRSLSLDRANQVVSELKVLAGDSLPGIEFATLGYGSIAPSACNSSENGRAINRRVEVWISQPKV